MSRIEKAFEKANQMREGKERREDEAPVTPPSSEAGGEPAAHAAIKPESPYLVTLTEPTSYVSEEYRKLKSMVVKLTKKDRMCNALMVTSAIGGEGKSITALNLAVTLAQEYDHSVLLVDADLRRPAVHTYLGLEPSRGLADCLANGTDVGSALVRTDVDRLVLLPAGKSVSDPVELLLSSRMKELVSELKHRYADRYVIFDTPPVLPFAEVHSLASHLDGVIFVVKEGLTPLEGVKEALEMLKGTTVLGAVYNAASISRLDGYYDYHYTYTHRAAGEAK
jgi:protein-tyrosine kinase